MQVQLNSTGDCHRISVTINGKDYSFVINEKSESYTQPIEKAHRRHIRFIDRMEEIKAKIQPSRSYTGREIATLLGMRRDSFHSWLTLHPVFVKTGMEKNRNLYRLHDSYVQK